MNRRGFLSSLLALVPIQFLRWREKPKGPPTSLTVLDECEMKNMTEVDRAVQSWMDSTIALLSNHSSKETTHAMQG